MLTIKLVNRVTNFLRACIGGIHVKEPVERINMDRIYWVIFLLFCYAVIWSLARVFNIKMGHQTTFILTLAAGGIIVLVQAIIEFAGAF